MTDTTDNKAPTNGAGPGRNTLYSEELGNRICERLAEGTTLKAICRMKDVPVAESTVRSWAINAEHPFSALYARAREVGYHMMADEVLDIADASGTEPGHVARDRLKVDIRKWLLSKALPKVYGDKLELSGNLNVSHEDRLRELEEMAKAVGLSTTDAGEVQ